MAVTLLQKSRLQVEDELLDFIAAVHEGQTPSAYLLGSLAKAFEMVLFKDVPADRALGLKGSPASPKGGRPRRGDPPLADLDRDEHLFRAIDSKRNDGLSLKDACKYVSEEWRGSSSSATTLERRYRRSRKWRESIRKIFRSGSTGRIVRQVEQEFQARETLAATLSAVIEKRSADGYSNLGRPALSGAE